MYPYHYCNIIYIYINKYVYTVYNKRIPIVSPSYLGQHLPERARFLGDSRRDVDVCRTAATSLATMAPWSQCGSSAKDEYEV